MTGKVFEEAKAKGLADFPGIPAKPQKRPQVTQRGKKAGDHSGLGNGIMGAGTATSDPIQDNQKVMADILQNISRMSQKEKLLLSFGKFYTLRIFYFFRFIVFFSFAIQVKNKAFVFLFGELNLP